jgi:hypothetical protein
VQALQGQVNILSAEKAELERRVTQLSTENESLKSQLTLLAQLQAQVAQLAAEKLKLAEINQQLTSANKRLTASLARKKTFVVSAHCATSIDLMLTDEPAAGRTREASSEGVETFLNDDQSVSAAHLYLTKSGSATEIRDEANPEKSHKIYVKLLNPANTGEAVEIDGALITVGKQQKRTKWPPLQLSPARPWMLVGTITIDQNYEPIFKEASSEERDAEWQAVSKKGAPSPTAGFRGEDAADKLRRLMRMSPDASGASDAEALRLANELLTELPPNDISRSLVEKHRDAVLANKARREGAAKRPSPQASPIP